MKNLILISNYFPYGNGEPYLESESGYFNKYFDNIYIYSILLRPIDLDHLRLIDSQIKVWDSPVPSTLENILLSYKGLLDVNFYKELKKIIRQKRVTLGLIRQLLSFLSKAHREANRLVKLMRKEGFTSGSEGVLYTYRFEFQPYIALLVQKRFPKFKIVSRGHRYDLYENFRLNKYIPLREYIMDNIDETVMIAQDGLDYLNLNYPHHGKCKYISRLGTLDFGLGPIKDYDKSLRLISCSTLTFFKRVHLIIEALSRIKSINIVWDHYGEGPDEENVKRLAKEKLDTNIDYNFHGHIANSALMNIYKTTPFDAFINVSSSEGVPVSIMEALSFGIPIIATDVGGTKEIVQDGYNGYLLDAEFKISELVNRILKIHEMKTLSNKEYQQIREQSRESWTEKSSAYINYNSFLKHISEICE